MGIARVPGYLPGTQITVLGLGSQVPGYYPWLLVRELSYRKQIARQLRTRQGHL